MRTVISDSMVFSAYNYERFDQYVESGQDDLEFSSFASHLHVGMSAPDATLTRLDDSAPVSLSELWSDRHLILEFGSFT
jgi:hypothetical protein